MTYLCRRYTVTRAAFYAWCRRGKSAHSQRDEILLKRIREVFKASDQTYGSPRIHDELKATGEKVSEKRIARLMRDAKLVARSARIYRRAKGVKQFFAQIPNLVLDLQTTALDQIWVGDITYLRVGNRWRYLAVVMDRHSRRIIGWSFGRQRGHQLTLDALDQAVHVRRPAAGLIFHSDRGIEYTQAAYRARLATCGIVQSTKRPTGFGDNAFIESFFHSMKSDVIHGHRFLDDSTLLRTVNRYIWRYNGWRRHSSIGSRSPIDFERLAA
ncbi:transposase InsO family protein [Panacagrimonas perspica]|uniref:Transposase InsO family protein n=1 Tax=Panacagrimonas perspica TaxID=381431 RepID=A0A4R7NYV1_9GAMM|nr:IS3 family transposase [Panacagrimonas perspica]TDU25921.1 transposase InsO family protein [Panacagrimonas perspica]